MKRLNSRSPRVLVVDDDPIFRSVIARLADRSGVSVTVCGALGELMEVPEVPHFDVAIIDYYLDHLQDKLRGVDLARLLENTPVILVSQSGRCLEESASWPDCVRNFMDKDIGAKNILKAAIRVGKVVSKGF